jgi:hypothetical protein
VTGLPGEVVQQIDKTRNFRKSSFWLLETNLFVGEWQYRNQHGHFSKANSGLSASKDSALTGSPPQTSA